MITTRKCVMYTGCTKFDLPIGAKVLTVKGQRNDVCIFVEIDTEAQIEKVEFEFYGEGHEIKQIEAVSREYVGSAQLYNENIVFHVYRLTRISR